MENQKAELSLAITNAFLEYEQQMKALQLEEDYCLFHLHFYSFIHSQQPHTIYSE
jgi:hypothetical protein